MKPREDCGLSKTTQWISDQDGRRAKVQDSSWQGQESQRMVISNGGHGERAKEWDRRVVRKWQRRIRAALSLGLREKTICKRRKWATVTKSEGDEKGRLTMVGLGKQWTFGDNSVSAKPGSRGRHWSAGCWGVSAWPGSVPPQIRMQSHYSRVLKILCCVVWKNRCLCL